MLGLGDAHIVDVVVVVVVIVGVIVGLDIFLMVMVASENLL